MFIGVAPFCLTIQVDGHCLFKPHSSSVHEAAIVLGCCERASERAIKHTKKIEERGERGEGREGRGKRGEGREGRWERRARTPSAGCRQHTHH